MSKKNIIIGIVLSLFLFMVHIFISDDYGATWDFHHHFFAGLKLLDHPITNELTANLPFSEPDPRNTSSLPFGPIMSLAPATTYVIFFEKLKLLAFDNAYNLSIVISGVAGILFLYLFLLEATNFPTALAGFALIALLPRYFGDLHNNMKDVPQAAAFTLAIWLFWRLWYYRRFKDLILASLAFAIAFNTKVNTIAVPIITLSWMIFLKPARAKIIYFYFLLAPIFAFSLWTFFWRSQAVSQLLYLPQFFRDNTQNIEVLFAGNWYCSAVNVPWYYPLGYLAITIPLPILLFFLIGLINLIIQIRQKKEASLFLLWFFLPLSRYLLPGMGVIDGIRHFEEVTFPLAAIAAVGLIALVPRRLVITFIIVITVINVIPVIKFHPFQISYFNEVIGGIRGAFGKYDLDYWGTSQKQAMLWLNQNAPLSSYVHVVMAADVAGKYLRPDLKTNLNAVGYDGADYVVVLNRQSFFYRYYWIVEYMLRRKPAYIVENQGIPLVWIYDNKLGMTLRQKEWWRGDSPCIRRYWTTPPP